MSLLYARLCDDLMPVGLKALTPPQRIEAALLGVLMGNDRLVAKAVQHGANAGWFTVPVHRKVWDAIAAIADRGGRFDVRLLIATMRELDDGDQTKLSEIAYLFGQGTDDAFLKAYCEHLRLLEGEREAAGIVAQGIVASSTDEFAAELSHRSGLLANLAESVADDGSSDPRNQVAAADEEVERASGDGVGLKTGLFRLDSVFRGWRPGEMIVCGARPAVGKSSLAVTVVDNILTEIEDAVVLYASAEMRDVEIQKRLISCRARVPISAMESRTATEEQVAWWRDARASFERRPCYVQHRGMQRAANVKAAATSLKMRRGRLDLVVVDHIHAMNDSAKGRTEQITNLSNAMACMARELEVPVLVLAQLNRAVESRDDKTPQLSDLRDSGALEQDGDIVFFLHRERLAGSEQKRDPVTSVNIAKHRRSRTGVERIYFHEEQTRFAELEPERGDSILR